MFVACLLGGGEGGVLVGNMTITVKKNGGMLSILKVLDYNTYPLQTAQTWGEVLVFYRWKESDILLMDSFLRKT